MYNTETESLILLMIPDGIKKYLEIPDLADEEQNRRAYLLKFTLLTLIIGAIIGIAIFVYYMDLILVAVFLFGLISVFFSFFLLRS